MPGHEETGPYVLRNNMEDNPGGALLEIFFAGREPDGKKLPEEVRQRLGSELIEAISRSPDFQERQRKLREQVTTEEEK